MRPLLNNPQVEPVHLDVREFGPLVRVGREQDGGYVLPAVLVERADILLSFGISNDWSFEADFLARNSGVRLHGFDGSVGAGHFMARAARSYGAAAAHLLMMKGSRYARSRNRGHAALDYFSFFRGRARHHKQFVRGSAVLGVGLPLAEIWALIGVTPADRIMLKIDIEGAEYGVLEDVAAFASQIDGIAIEFHDVNARRTEFQQAIEHLARDFVLVHVHGNNYDGVSPDGFPNAVEVTYLSRALAGDAASVPTGTLPRPGLDFPNDPSRPDISLAWIGSSVARRPAS